VDIEEGVNTEDGSKCRGKSEYEEGGVRKYSPDNMLGRQGI